MTKKLATTTISLLGMKDFFDANTPVEAEGCIMHDLFHPVSYAIKSNLARNVEWATALTKLNFDNLRKRVPAKASDCGIALNFPTLLRKARSYEHTVNDLPTALMAPPGLTIAIAQYQSETDPARHQLVVEELRKMSQTLVIPSVFVAGFMLGRERRAHNDPDMTLRLAAKTNTILGSPAYERSAGEHAGIFAQGCALGFVPPAYKTIEATKAMTGKMVTYYVEKAEWDRAALIHSRDPAADPDDLAEEPQLPVVGAATGWFWQRTT